MNFYGLKAELIQSGDSSKIVVSGDGNSYVAKSSASGASNVVDTLLGGTNGVGTSAKYIGKETVTTTATTTVGASRDTLLSNLGITNGEYYIYSNDVKNTVQIQLPQPSI